MRKLLLTLAAFALSGAAFAQTNIGTVSLEQLGTANDVDAVCTATNLDIRDLSSAQDSVQCNAGTNLNTSALALETTLGNRLAEATFIGRMPAGASPADNESNTITALSRFGSFNFFFDGTTWDRAPGTAADGMLVNLGANNDVTVTGTVTANAGTDLNTSALLTTTAHNDAFGTAGSADTQVRTVQGIAGGTALPVSAASLPLPSGAATSANQAYLDPCQREATISINIEQTAGEQLITGTASERIYICSIHFLTTTAQTIALVSGTGTVCATSITAVDGFGGASAALGQPFAANGGIALAAAGHKYGNTTADADNVCLLQSGGGQITGGLTYVSAASGL